MHEELESYPKEHGRGAYLLKYGTQGVALMHLQPNGQLFSCGGDGTVKCRQLSIRETIVNTKLPWTGFCVDQKNTSKWILCQIDCQDALNWALFWTIVFFLFSSFPFPSLPSFWSFSSLKNLPFDAFSLKWLQIWLSWFSKNRVDIYWKKYK